MQTPQLRSCMMKTYCNKIEVPFTPIYVHLDSIYGTITEIKIHRDHELL
jgi:hypothetical protein